MSFSDREKHLIRAAFAWGQTAQKEGYTLSDMEMEKSVLFRRLLAGRPPLAFPPPLRHGFPWYEVIEGRGQHVVNASEASPECSIIAPGSKPGDTCILIDGAFWRVVETVREREEYIVEWGDYPMRWRLKKQWEVNYEMTQQLHNFRRENPNSEIAFDSGSGGRECNEFRIDAEQTVWLSEWQLSRIGLSGWVWVGTPLELNDTPPLATLYKDQNGPLLIGEQGQKRGSAWLRIERADDETRLLKLGENLEYQALITSVMDGSQTLLHGVEGDSLEILDWRNDSPLRHYRVPTQLTPLEDFELGDESFDLMPENANPD